MKTRSVLVLTMIAALAGATAWAGGDGDVALKGYCPVAYAAMGKAVEGKAELTSQHGGQTYRFLNADAKGMFDQAPDKYLPAYGGYCATAVTQGQKVESDPKIFSLVNGRTYLFSTKKAKAMFEKDPAATIAMADARWPELARTAN